MIDTRNGLDIFGDIHGHAAAIQGALAALGYEKIGDVWRHPHGRRALFLGDLIDRGEQGRAVVSLVRSMVAMGEALCLMGNHELNAIHFATPNDDGGHLRSRNANNIRQHRAFLEEHAMFDADGGVLTRPTDEYARDIEWFRTLPVAADFGILRAVHAAWVEPQIDIIKARTNLWRIEGASDFAEAANRDRPLGSAVSDILKGPEVDLPIGLDYRDKDGHVRTSARLCWWSPASDFGGAVLASKAIADRLSGASLPDAALGVINADGPPVIFGHYWMKPESGCPAIGRPNRLCLDFSIAGSDGDGLIGVYRWDGEDAFNAAKLFGANRSGALIKARC